MLFPPTCGGCEKIGSRWCEECQNKVKILDGIVCNICGLPQEQAGTCKDCLVDRPHFCMLRAWAIFENPIQHALHKLKYRKDMSMGDAIAFQMLPFVQKLNWQIDMIVPVPLGKRRLRQRGYNQVAMIAKPLALGLQIKYTPNMVVRKRETRTQVGLNKAERKKNVEGAFQADPSVKRKNILIIDDVSTTGSTLSSIAEAFYQSGADNVYALTVARALQQHSLQTASINR